MTGLEIFSDNWEGSASGENLKPRDWKGTPTKEGVQGLNLWLRSQGKEQEFTKDNKKLRLEFGEKSEPRGVLEEKREKKKYI